jgi:3-hydroxyisobutyrate dehydrogenase-like beta-hydroxyacid dehydrogenase
MAKKEVGLIGVGLLGSAVAERWLAAGYAVTGFDTDAARREALAAMGGTAAISAGEVFARARRVALVLPHSAVNAKVLDAARPLAAGAVIIDMTTGDPEEMAAMGAALARDGVGYLDATIGGSSAVVRGGGAIVMAGGEREVFTQCEELFAPLAERIFHVGEAGAGARMKLAMNLVLGLNRAALAEGLAFAEACGLPLDVALEVFRAGPAWSRAMDAKGRKMITGEFAPEARLAQHRKDVELILAQAARCGARTPLSAVHRGLLEEVERAGLGGADNSAIIRAYRH